MKQSWNHSLVTAITLCCFMLTLLPTAAMAAKGKKEGKVLIYSTTVGAEIVIDGKEIAKVPYEDPISLSVGEHEVEVALRGYVKHREKFDISQGEVTELEIDLIAVDGVVMVDTPGLIDAMVIVDGQVIGVTPFDGLIPAGTHTLTIAKNGFVEQSQEIRIHAGRKYTLDFELAPDAPPVPVMVAATPPPQTVEASTSDGPTPFYASWWFWTLAGVGVAGAITGVALTQPPTEVAAPYDHVIQLELPAFSGGNRL